MRLRLHWICRTWLLLYNLLFTELKQCKGTPSTLLDIWSRKYWNVGGDLLVLFFARVRKCTVFALLAKKIKLKVERLPILPKCSGCFKAGNRFVKKIFEFFFFPRSRVRWWSFLSEKKLLVGGKKLLKGKMLYSKSHSNFSPQPFFSKK